MSAAAPVLSTKVDKYEQVLAKYDWRSPFPPRGYQYGIGRGAKAFITSAELSATTGVSAPLLALGGEQSAMLDALDRLEERRHKRRREDVKGGATSREGKKPKLLLSMEDIATVGSGASNQSLVKRKARTEDMDVVDGYAFDDETAVVTASDLLRGRALAANQTLENILNMGSSSEQTTWITHSRALREMGMTKKAQQTLVEGSRLTGSKGPLIWKEQLQHLNDPAAQRQLLEQAVAACKTCEELWFLLLQYQPPHEQLHWLQKAVMACPASESLWLRILGYVTAPRDQRKIIRKALEVTPTLPSLWAMLARLEDYERGKAIFNAAAAEHPSMKIIIEGAKFEEFHLRGQVGSEKEGGNEQLHNAKIHSLVRQAAQRFLLMDEEKSRTEWLDAARVAVSERYILTSAYMLLHFVCDTGAATLTIPVTWLEDLAALVPDMWRAHDVLCAAWATMLIGRDAAVKGTNEAVTEKDVQIIGFALRSAPFTSLETAVSAVTRYISSTTVSYTSRVEDGMKKEGIKEEEEEEELGRPVATIQAAPPTCSTSATAASQCLPLPLVSVLLYTLFRAPAFNTIDVMLSVAKVFYDHHFYDGAHRVLMLAITRYPVNALLFTAAAKTKMAMGCRKGAEELLLKGTAIDPSDSDIAWVKLAVHRRSNREDIVPLLDEALVHFPTSERLWLMRLEAEGMKAQQLLEDAMARGSSTAPTINGLRRVYGKALSSEHCRLSPTIWCYAAVKLESNLFSDAGAARALLLEGLVVCEKGCQHLHHNGSTKRAEVRATFGLARCHVELRHAGSETALETVKEVLQQLPKVDGCFTVSVGELVALSIDLENPATRGRAAAQAVQHWRVRDPLVFSSVAKLYHAAGRHEKALEQAMKAVQMSKGRCGDAVALWLKLASMFTYRKIVMEKMGLTVKDESNEEETALQNGVLLAWLWKQLANGSSGGTSGSEAMEDMKGSTESATHSEPPKPNSGPLWIYVSKSRDPSNVTLLGFRDSVEVMLTQVVEMIKL
ncbi:U5 snRNP-associated 102 kDa protein, putative [Trypanosoma equiperdum]|uniref:PRP1 splicing factor N-terminal domain-containing protein n=2 Tax=Trypanozoon TaxID=39700 RepID=Q381L7_TRYB2|nr:hypothetical protein, conserved [Trypanosoma brucei brucei TREU927]EAN80514.1 hypothetical protein, conserved [Trypanosoma brucei brucei TREU927]SCU70187.1 U5 snRNP-associated 102 kDa protein, putative [Trypanosoma equiperdum]